MANEAVCIEPYRIVKRYSVTDAVGISKGALLMLSSADFYALSSAHKTAGITTTPFCGIAIEEKVAGDGITEIGAAIDGDWDIKCNATVAVTKGAIVSLSGANLIINAAAGNLLDGSTVGKALEGGSTSEVIRVRIGGLVV